MRQYTWPGTAAEAGLDPDQASVARDALELCVYQVSQHLAKGIHKVAVVAGPEAYPSWPAYAAAFMERGGVIEACASGKQLLHEDNSPCSAVPESTDLYRPAPSSCCVALK